MAEFLTIRQAILQGTDILSREAVDAPRLTAEVLLAHALQVDRTYLFAHADDPLSELAWIHYGRYLHQRAQGVPNQYVTGRQEFFGRTFLVNPSVLIPRPETEHLVEAALNLGLTGKTVVDIGTGSGAIAISVQLESRCQMFAGDLSADALAVAKKNAQQLGAQVSFFQSDLALSLRNRSVDVLLSNPPYIARADLAGLQREVRDHEPLLALIGGELGIEPYQALLEQARFCLKPCGWIVLEIASEAAAIVIDLLKTNDFAEIELIKDLAGLPRTIMAQLGTF